MTPLSLQSVPDETDSANREYWLELQRGLDAHLQAAVSGFGRAVYIDYPVHSNAGDLLIYLGTEVWLEASGLEISGRWHLHNFNFPTLPAETVVLLHGGGNFGDRYVHQALRERIVEAYPKHRIVVLPQTVHFESAETMARSAAILNRHRDLHLFVRDRVSLELVEAQFTGAVAALVPDMASFVFPAGSTIGGLHPGSPRRRRYCLLRRDSERNPLQDSVTTDCDWRGDWRQVLGVRRWAWIRLWQLAGLGGQALPAAGFARGWLRTARALLRHCANELLTARLIVTSRLHGHIFASLLGIPNVLLDNSYGKNSRYFDSWSVGRPETLARWGSW